MQKSNLKSKRKNSKVFNLKKELAALIAGEVRTDAKTLAKYSRDASVFEVRPKAVVFPKILSDVKKLVSFATAHKDKHISLTARSGGTDMTGGPLSESVVVDFNKYFNRIISVKNNSAVVQPGVFYRDFEKETLKHNLLLPSFPASREICTVGGMVANNASGEETHAYGDTGDFVIALRAVLSDGNEYELKPLNRSELDATMEQENFEGALCRNIFRLLDENYDIIKAAKPNVSKNSSGYLLWDVWDREKGVFDLTKLFAGSQGTLGLVTEVTFRLIRPKPARRLLVMFLRDISRLGEIIQVVNAGKPESFEAYDDKTLQLVLKFLPGFVALMGAKNLFLLARQFLPEFGMVLTGGLPRLVLLAEFAADTDEEALHRAEEIRRRLEPFNMKTRVAHDVRDNEAEEKKYWTIRHEAFNLLRFHLKKKRTAPVIDDIIVAPERLPEFLPKLDTLLERYRGIMTYALGGHVGDGNFHIYAIMDMHDARVRAAIPDIVQSVYRLVLDFGGSITAEHNDGIIRTPYLSQMYGDQVCGLFAHTKRIFDPDNIFNPGKKVGGTWDFAMAHLVNA